jgi:hypothetical protein
MRSTASREGAAPSKRFEPDSFGEKQTDGKPRTRRRTGLGWLGQPLLFHRVVVSSPQVYMRKSTPARFWNFVRQFFSTTDASTPV